LSEPDTPSETVPRRASTRDTCAMYSPLPGVRATPQPQKPT